jgi:agmatine deiminase
MSGHSDPDTPSGGAFQQVTGRRQFLAAAGLTAAGAAWAVGAGGSAALAAQRVTRAGAGRAGATTAGRAATITADRAAVTTADRAAVTTGTGFAVPVDHVEHTRTWMAWPDSVAIWGKKLLPGAQADIALIASTIAKYEPVIVCANAASVAAAQAACGPAVTVIGSIPVNDCWMRDSGPIFRTNGAGGLDAVGLNFNGWGGKQVHNYDAVVASRVAAYAAVPFTAAGFVSEGGAIETDGAGTLMATKSSIIEPDRNPGMTQAQLTTAMCAAYGASEVIWFTGIKNHDITDDHVDATSRFLNPGAGLVQLPTPPGATDIWSKDEDQQYQVLSASTDAQGNPIMVSIIRGPNYNKIRSTNPEFVGAYANYYVCNGAVISAQFGDAATDEAAYNALVSLFPGRVIEQLDIDALGDGGGGIHCVTQQQPVA